MSDSSTLFPDTFGQQVRECLAHLYDFSVLHSSLLAEQLAPQLTGSARVQAVREIFIQALEKLDLHDTHDAAKQSRAYNLLYLRYVEEQTPHEVQHRLSLSERQYYREHKNALDALSNILWDRVENAAPAALPQPMSVQSEIVRAALHSAVDTFSLEELFAGVVNAVQAIADNFQVNLDFERANRFPPLSTNRMVLRQILILITLQAVKSLSAGSTIRVRASMAGYDPCITFDLIPDAAAQGLALDAFFEALESDVFQSLRETLRAEFSCNADREGTDAVIQFRLMLPHSQQIILVIDDNPDVVSIIKSHLTALPYQVVSVNDAREGLDLAQKLRPVLIILDIMLPQMDGWEILQNLKNHPLTHDTRVFICSVIHSPDLAQSLGADGFLSKPPDQQSLLTALARIADSEPRSGH